MLASIEKMVPTLEDVSDADPAAGALGDGPGDLHLHHLLHRARAAPAIPDGPQACHVVILDNGRSELLGTPVPRGAALHPLRRLHEPLPGLRRRRRPRLRLGLSRAHRLGADPGAPRRAAGRPPAQRLDVLRALRGGLPDEDPAAGPDAALARGGVRARAAAPGVYRAGLRVWASSRKRPRLYHAPRGSACRCSARFGRGTGAFRWLPLARGWTRHRDLAAPQGRTFQQLWAERQAGVRPMSRRRADTPARDADARKIRAGLGV